MQEQQRTIYKYTFTVAPEMVMELPQSAKLLKVADAHGDGRSLSVWAEVPPGPADEPVRERVLRVFGTGTQTFTGLDGFEHWETVITAGGGLVWHVYLDMDGAKELPAPIRPEGF